MAPKLYELRFIQDGRDLRDAQRITYALDLDLAPETQDVIERHILAACERASVGRRYAYKVMCEVRETREGRPTGADPVLRWALPIRPEDRR